MIAERIGQHEVLLPVNQNYDNRNKLTIGNTFSYKTTDNSAKSAHT